MRRLAAELPSGELPGFLADMAGELERARWTVDVRLRGRSEGVQALLTVKDVADMLQVDASTVTRWAAPGARLAPAARRIAEGTLRFDRRVLERLVATS
jgi:hypothetical protein